MEFVKWWGWFVLFLTVVALLIGGLAAGVIYLGERHPTLAVAAFILILSFLMALATFRWR